MTFEEFTKSLADAVEQAVEEDGGESPCYLCFVLDGSVTTPEKQVREYTEWDVGHAKTLQQLIEDAENSTGYSFRDLLTEEYYGAGRYGNPARIQWLREGAPIFWEK